MTIRLVQLRECCQIKPPKAEARKLLGLDDLVSFVPMKNLGIDTSKVYLDDERKLSEVSDSYTYFAENDVLLAKITPCFENGKLGIAKGLKNGVGFGSSEFIVFRPSTDLLPEYLYYFLNRPGFRELGQAVMTGAVGHKRVPKEFIESTLIPLPPIQEQKRIVTILDQVFAGIDQARATAETNLKNARELFDSYLQQVFSQRGADWQANKLKNITSKIGSGATPRGGKDAYKEEGMSLIRSMNVYDRAFREKNLAFIDDEQADKLKNVEILENDVLLNITGASVARCCVVPAKILPARVNQHVSIIRADGSILNAELLCFLLTSKFYKDKLLGIGEAGSTRQAITKVQIQDFEIVFPKSLDEQVILLSDLESLKVRMLELQNVYIQKIQSLNELKKSILQKAFSGELTRSTGNAA